MNKEPYIAPKITVATCKVEHGFGLSDSGPKSFMLQMDELPQEPQGNEASRFGTTSWEW